MGKLFNIILIVAGVVLFIWVVDYFSPIKIKTLLTKDLGGKEGVCSRLINVNDSSMEPILKEGSTYVFNRCIESLKDDLDPGTVVLVEKLFSERIISVVRKKEEDFDEIKYKVSPPLKLKDLTEVNAKDITAIYQPSN